MDLPAPEGPDITIGRYFWFTVVAVSRDVVLIGLKLNLRVGAIVVERRVRQRVGRYTEATVGPRNKAGGLAGRRSMRWTGGTGCF